MFVKKEAIALAGIVYLSLIFYSSACFAGDIIPTDLNKPVPETSSIIRSEGGRICTRSNAKIIAGSQHLNHPAEIIIQDYFRTLEKIYLNASDTRPSVLAAVRIIFYEKELFLQVTVPLIKYVQPAAELDVVKPNLTGTSWAKTDMTAIVGADGFSATFEVRKQGAYAVYNPERKACLREKLSQKTVPSAKSGTSREGGDWGLISENEKSEDKIPLILVHGDNSYKVKNDRWGDFLNWVSDNSDVDNTYEIWRFHHDTRKRIGFDGNSGNAKELGDAITREFGTDRHILLLAHSRGGLVSRAYMCKYGDGNHGDRVLGLVTLATPHHGSPGAVPDWGLHTIEGKFRDTSLANIFYGYDDDAVVNVTDFGTMELAWDNFDGPENGIPYVEFSLESHLGNDHILSVMDANVENPSLGESETDETIYIPDRSFGTLEELNQDQRYFGKIIAYAGYDTELGGWEGSVNWLSFSFTDHVGLEIATHVMADMVSKGDIQYYFVANDGMVPLQSALFLKKDAANEPVYETEKDNNWFAPDSYEVRLKDFSARMNFRKAVLCPDYDHLHMIEGKGGLLYDKTDYWDHVASSLDELAKPSETSYDGFTPEVVTISDSLPAFSSIVSGDNCFIQTASNTSPIKTGRRFSLLAMPILLILALQG